MTRLLSLATLLQPFLNHTHVCCLHARFLFRFSSFIAFTTSVYTPTLSHTNTYSSVTINHTIHPTHSRVATHTHAAQCSNEHVRSPRKYAQIPHATSYSHVLMHCHNTLKLCRHHTHAIWNDTCYTTDFMKVYVSVQWYREGVAHRSDSDNNIIREWIVVRYMVSAQWEVIPIMHADIIRLCSKSIRVTQGMQRVRARLCDSPQTTARRVYSQARWRNMCMCALAGENTRFE